MKVKFCPFCGRPLHGTIRFCPGCGESLEGFFRGLGHSRPAEDFRLSLKRMLEDFIEHNAELLEDLAARVERGEPFEKGMFFAVEMKGDKPVIRSGDISELGDMLKGTPFYSFFHGMASSPETGKIEFREVKAEVSSSGDGRLVTVELPGVSTMDDVMINRLEDGLEIAARGKGVFYFSKADLKGPFTVKDTRLSEGRLTIQVT
ncbi:MAG: hypothetical protein D6733_03960 [Methanobacteriota archaeon]|nr:MAG: hypothetical protein D6733_03960 [Euryarchaeota archaeon]